MALHQKKHLKRLELPEVVAVVLLVLATIPATVWFQANVQPLYEKTVGHVVSCNIQLTHYNATDVRPKVSLTYSYAAPSGPYTGSWTGFWPSVQSPNAMAENQLNVLYEKDHPLTVLYDRNNPSQSLLHYPDDGYARVSGIVALAAVAVALAYCGAVYPTWRSHL